MPTGVGDHLAKLISWATLFLINSDQCSNCRKRIKLMNTWGPKGCEINRPTIHLWLQAAAKEQGIPYNRTIVNMMITEAIRRARKEEPRQDLDQSGACDNIE